MPLVGLLLGQLPLTSVQLIIDLLLYNTSNPNTANNITINIQGVGSIYEIITSPSGVGYTYAALNQFNNQISAFSSSSNFTNLSGGTYSVYGL